MKATALLKRQHREVEALFATAKKVSAPKERRSTLDLIAAKLRTHMMIEEQIFYPAVAESATTKSVREMMPEAYEEHHVVRLVLDELPQVDTKDERFEAKVTVLSELVEHHVEEEEGEMFPAAEKTLGAAALTELGERMQAAMDDGPGGAADDDADEDVAEEDEGEEDEEDEEDDEEESAAPTDRAGVGSSKRGGGAPRPADTRPRSAR